MLIHLNLYCVFASNLNLHFRPPWNIITSPKRRPLELAPYLPAGTLFKNLLNHYLNVFIFISPHYALKVILHGRNCRVMILALGRKERGIMVSEPVQTRAHQSSGGAESRASPPCHPSVKQTGLKRRYAVPVKGHLPWLVRTTFKWLHKTCSWTLWGLNETFGRLN